VEALGLDAIHLELSKYRYCTVFVVEGEDLDSAGLEAMLEAMGDSLLVVGDSSALKVHVHTDDPGAALTAATALGVVEGVEIANMHQQTVQREERLLETAGSATATLEAGEVGVVAVCPGQGNRRLFESLGAARVIEGGQTMNPSAAELVDAIESVQADEVIVLPNNSNVILTAEQAAGLSSKSVRVVPSSSVQAGLAAMGRFVPTNSADDNEEDMRGALAEAATGEVTVASRDVELDGVSIRKGAYLGLVDGTAVISSEDVDAVIREVVERVLEGKDTLTILTGENAPQLEGLVAALEREHPLVEFGVHPGGQPHYPLLVVAE
jgi:dihydroxyacetone kinase-like predicted kinase